jgi:hypothetical protein
MEMAKGDLHGTEQAIVCSRKRYDIWNSYDL